MGRIWPYAWAFSIMCIIFTICKIAGLEWAADRQWGEVIFFLCVAIAIITCFFLRKKITALYTKLKDKLS